MKKGYKYRIYPTEEQKVFLSKNFGCARWIYNYALAIKKEAWEKDKTHVSIREISLKIPILKKEEETAFLSEVISLAIINSLRNLDTAYNNYFRELKKEKKKKKEDRKPVHPPKFKKRSSTQSFQIHQGYKIDFENGLLFLPKLRDGIKTIYHRDYDGIPKTITISKVPSGKYFVSILIDDGAEVVNAKEPDKNDFIGLDVGVRHLFTLSDGRRIENNKFLAKSIDRLRILQQRQSKKEKGSKNKEKANIKVAKLHEHIAKQREHYIYNVVKTEIIEKGYNTVCFENFGVKNISNKNKPVKDENGNYVENGREIQKMYNRYLYDASLTKLRTVIQQKCEDNGINTIVVDSKNKTMRTCHICGYVDEDLKLEDVIFECKKCNNKMDRHHNSALFIKKLAIESSLI